MKKLKIGFSLAEILIAVGIISVIATMGFSITARNIDKAYDLYIYNGYKSLTDAIRDANFHNKELKTNQTPTPVAESLDVNNEFLKHLEDLFDGELSISGAKIKLETPNNVNFIFNQNNILVSDENNEPQQTTLYEITMQVPIKRQKNNNNGNIITSEDFLFYYVPEWHDTVFPAETNRLSTRIDLLPTYIDDGVAGHVIEGEYQRITYRDFKDSICQTLGDLSFNSNNNDQYFVTSDCTNIPLSNGIIRVANPRKVF